MITYGHLGDTMLSIPALRSLRNAAPTARIEVLVLESARAVLAGCPYIDELIDWRDFQRKGSSLARLEKGALVSGLGMKLRLRRYDAVLVMHRSARPMRTLAGLVGARVRAGVSDGSDHYTHAVQPHHGVELAREHNARVLATVGIEEDGGPGGALDLRGGTGRCALPARRDPAPDDRDPCRSRLVVPAVAAGSVGVGGFRPAASPRRKYRADRVDQRALAAGRDRRQPGRARRPCRGHGRRSAS